MIILGSSSISRLEMLKRITDINPTIIAPDIDEASHRGEIPRLYAQRISKEKLESVIQKSQHLIDGGKKVIICADTVCARGRIILPKADNDADVKYCMKLISGRNHDVITSISANILGTNIFSHKISTTKVKFKNLSDKDIDDMVKSKNGIGKAGGYGINGYAESFIMQINGSYSGIVGFPLYHIRNILISFGFI